MATISHQYYDNHLRGGEGHMEVGKLIQTVEHRKAHMVISVKPFGCMPSSGVSDGVQSLITARYPEAIFTAIETTGDGEVNVQSRIQMDLFKARKRAEAEFRDGGRRRRVLTPPRSNRGAAHGAARCTTRRTSSPARRRTRCSSSPVVKASHEAHAGRGVDPAQRG